MPSNKMWGGRFKKRADKDVEKFTSSISIDQRLAKYDLLGSLVHIEVLNKAKIISRKEFEKLKNGIKALINDVRKNKFSPSGNSEDIHTDIQNKLEKRIGKVALKLHSSRSRNEQVVFDVKMYCKSEIKNLMSKIEKLQKEVKNFARKNKALIIPGYTHMQHAQPIRFYDYILAYFYMLGRDADRLVDIDKRIKISLGAGALAGTSIEKSFYSQAIKKVLTGHNIQQTAIGSAVDSVSDRDFVIEILAALAILGMHLSRLAEDFIIWSTKEFSFIDVDESFCTGSSLMPQKKNPDVLELIRGNCGKLYANSISILVTMKGLPLGYNRDMQLDKEPLFNSIDIVVDELNILSRLVSKIKVNKKNIIKQLEDESLYATDLADYLVNEGVPFKEAHKIIGRLISYSVDNKKRIKDLTGKELKKFSGKLNAEEVRKRINPYFSVGSKKSKG